MDFLTMLAAGSPRQVRAGLVSSEAALLGLQMAAFPLGPHPGSPLCLSVSSPPLTSTPGILA